MAYGAKYIATFSDVYQNTKNQYNVIIYKKDYSDYVYELSCDGEPFVVQTDRVGDSSYRPVIGSTAQFNVLLQNITLRYWEDIPTNWDAYTGLWNGETFDFGEFLTAEPDTFYVELKKKNVGGTYDLKWKGWYTPTSDTTIEEIEPILFSLTFSDLTLMKSFEYGENTVAPPVPATLATVSFAQSTGGNLTFDASTSSGLVIDTTTGGYYRIKNATATPVSVRLNITLDLTNNLQFGDVATLQALSSNDASVNTVIEFFNLPIYQFQNTATATFDFSLNQNDGIRFNLSLSNILPPYTPSGSLTILTTSGAIAQEPVNFDSDAVRYNAREHDTITNILLDCAIQSRLDYNIKINSSFSWFTSYGTSEGGPIFTTLDITNLYLYHNSFMQAPSKYKSYYDVLSGICSHFGLMAYQKNGLFYISTYDDLVNTNSREYKTYSYVDKSLLGTSIETDTVISLNSSDFKNIGRSQEVRYILPTKYIDLVNKPAETSNQLNWDLDVIEERLVTGSVYETYISNWTIYGYASKSLEGAGIDYRQGALSEYARSATSPYNFYYNAASIYADMTAQNDSKYLETSTGVPVKQGDFISISYSTATDARLNPTYKPSSKYAIVLRYPDPQNTANKLTFYLNNTQTKFVPTLTYQILPEIDIVGLKIPKDGEIFLRILVPWANPIGSNSSPTTASWLYFNYAIIQTYNGANPVPAGQTFRTFVADNFYNSESLTLNSNLYQFDFARFNSPIVDPNLVNGPAIVPDRLSSTAIVNMPHDEYHNMMISTDNNVANLITENIYKNTGFPNTTISGRYKSTGFGIGDKFSYAITGFTQKNFVLLDYMNSYKSGAQDVVLYSSEFVDTSEKDIITQVIVD